jgi:nucleoside-diphosphate-sugar epimerase
MSGGRPTVVVTGVAGNLGLRLLPLLSAFSVVGIDFRQPRPGLSLRFEQMDLGLEISCRQMVALLRDTKACALVHLAFVIDPVRTGVLDRERMWQINVAGTARVMEAIAEVNRSGGAVRKFVFPSSVSAYGPELSAPASEDQPLAAHTLPYAQHKQEADEVVRLRAASLGACSTYLLRPHVFAGASMDNYLIGVLRGTPGGRGRLGAWLRRKGKRLPLLLPRGEPYLSKSFQFVHVDDMARLITFILQRPERAPETVVLNVAGRGEPVSIGRGAVMAGQKIVRLPSVGLCHWTLQLLWRLGISSVPPEALPYMIGSYLMDTRRLRAFLGPDYEQVIQYTVEEALEDSFRTAGQPQELPQTAPTSA